MPNTRRDGVSLSIYFWNPHTDALPPLVRRDTIQRMQGPIHLQLDDGWQVDFTEREDGTLNVLVSSPSGRSWTTDRATMAEAIEVSVRIRAEQQPQVLDERSGGIG